MIPTTVIPLAAAVMTGLAGAGVVMPFIRSSAIKLERLNDPLEDERLNLLRTLRELDRDRAAGVIADEDYRALRAETELRALVTLRALRPGERRGELAAAFMTFRAAPRAKAVPAGNRSLGLPALLVAIAVATATVPLLFTAAHQRAAGELITGNVPAGASEAPSPIAFFEKRVREHPDDLGARLELAQQYLEAGDVRLATQQYLDVIKLDPKNTEANTKLGYLVYLAGLPDQGLRAVNRALETDPAYPDALYLKGVILLQGLNRPAEAAAVFRSYLAQAPFGSHRTEVEKLLEGIGGGGQ